MSEAKEYDVLVVGARVAGAATAMLLARAGLDVLVLERGRPGIDTLSTLALMRCGVMQLHRWGLLDGLVVANTPPIHRSLFLYAEETLAVDIQAANGVDSLYAPRRTVLDPLLAQAAKANGAELRYQVAVDDLIRDDQGRVSGVIGRDPDGGILEARARFVVGADGYRSVVARSVAAPVVRSGVAAGGTIYGFFRGVGDDAYEWAFNDGAAAGVIPTNDDSACVFTSTTSERFMNELRKDLATSYRLLLEHVNPGIAERVAMAESAEKLRGFPGVVSYLRRSSGPGWALVGDAAYFKDPITAHGLSDALRDAEILARAIEIALTDPERETEALRDYESTRDELAHDLFEATDRIARYDWSLDEVRRLHRDLSRAMKAENKYVAQLGPPHGAAAPTGLETQLSR